MAEEQTCEVAYEESGKTPIQLVEDYIGFFPENIHGCLKEVAEFFSFNRYSVFINLIDTHTVLRFSKKYAEKEALFFMKIPRQNMPNNPYANKPGFSFSFPDRDLFYSCFFEEKKGGGFEIAEINDGLRFPGIVVSQRVRDGEETKTLEWRDAEAAQTLQLMHHSPLQTRFKNRSNPATPGQALSMFMPLMLQ